MRQITLEELLEAGCHFGHQVTRQNPKARDFIFEARDNIHIIDLAKTKEGLEEAMRVVSDIALRNGTLLIVGAKRQAQAIVKEEVSRIEKAQGIPFQSAGIYVVTSRWIGGTLTNFTEVAKNAKKLKDLTELLKDEGRNRIYTKRELGLMERERSKLERLYGGTSEMSGMPDAIFIIDTHFEDLAVREAHKMGVLIIGIVDTNSDPTCIDYPIPANDDAVGSLKLITSVLVDSWIAGKKKQKDISDKEEKKQETVQQRSEKKQQKKTRQGKGAKPTTATPEQLPAPHDMELSVPHDMELQQPRGMQLSNPEAKPAGKKRGRKKKQEVVVSE